MLPGKIEILLIFYDPLHVAFIHDPEHGQWYYFLKGGVLLKLWCIDCKCAAYISKVRGSSKNPHHKETIFPHRV